MVRAYLHYAVAIDAELEDASAVDPSLFDPIVRVEGGVPGLARPFRVIRDYCGPQGAYAERFELRDRTGRVLYRSDPQRVWLTGEAFEDRVRSVVRDLTLDTGDELELALLLDGEELGTVPVFVEAGQGGDMRVAAEQTFAKAVSKGTILWLAVPRNGGEHTQPVWFVYEGGKVYVLTGPSEQDVDGLTDVDEATIIARSKDLRSEVSRTPADVRVVHPEEPAYAKVIDTALSKRLNLVSLEEAKQRWRHECTLVELSPRFHAREPGSRPTSRPRAAAATTAAATTAAPAAEPNGEAAAEPATQPAPASATEDTPVEAQIDQEVFDELVAAGTSERVARAKAKAAYVRREKERLRNETTSA